nr:integrase, catalytic region, zinc finger, CCHC-type, peptidase aspartic, catalytic [Tanacetum cinerariifolium]
MVIMQLKERIKSLSGNLKEEKIKQELEEIETINIELDHRVTKLVTKNENLKQTYKQLYDLIKSSCIRSKEQCDDLIKQANIKSAENSDLNASLQEKVLVIIALKDTLRKLKGKVVVDEAVTLHPIDPELLKINPSGNTKKDRIQQTKSSAKKNKLEAYPSNVRTSFQNKNSVVNTKDIAYVPNSKLNVNSDLQCVTCNGFLFSYNHDSCVLEFINFVNARVKSKSAKKPLNRKNNGTEFVNQTLREYYEQVGISHETSVARSPQQNGVVEIRNRTLIEAARTISGPALYEMTLVTISLGLVPKPTSSTPFVPPSRNNWYLLFQPFFDELLTPPPSVDPLTPKVIAPIDEVVALESAESTGSPSSKTIYQDAPSLSLSAVILSLIMSLKCKHGVVNLHLFGQLRSSTNANTTNTQKGTGASQKATCYECGNQGHYRRDCLKRKNQNHETQIKSTKARGVVHAFEGGETEQDLNNIKDEIE